MQHLGGKIPDSFDFDEMVCDGCSKICDFLYYYNINSQGMANIVKVQNYRHHKFKKENNKIK